MTCNNDLMPLLATLPASDSVKNSLAQQVVLQTRDVDQHNLHLSVLFIDIIVARLLFESWAAYIHEKLI